MAPNVTWVILVIFIGCYGQTGAFLFDDCEASLPCMCRLNRVECSHRHLPAVPAFKPLHVQRHGLLYLYLQDNNILVLPDGSFHGLNSSKYYIDLSANKISYISQRAFDGIEDHITILNLEGNRLRELPIAVARLSSLVSLDIRFNEISYFDAFVMQPLGSHLEILYVGSDALKTWPMEFQSLKNLTSFHLHEAGINDIPEHALFSFAKTLVYLDIKNSALTSVPQCICDLQQLLHFKFSGYQHPQVPQDFLPNCSSPITTVETVTLNDNQLDLFPDVFRIFTNMRSLTVIGNPKITSMSNIVIPSNTLITTLTLSSNNFSSIPVELSAMQHLHSLDMGSNNITEIQSDDLSNIHSLVRLSLDYNSVSIIEDGAFANATSLRSLSLSSTGITSIPEEVQDLVALRTLNLSGNEINCTCTAVAWTQHWAAWNRLSITGRCTGSRTGESVKTFILQQLQICK